LYISQRSQRLISEREFERERERERERLWGFETQRTTAMAESNDSVSVDMEKIYLGGKVRVFLQESIRFYRFCFFAYYESISSSFLHFSGTLLYCIWVDWLWVMPCLFAKKDWKRNGLVLLFGKSKSENHWFFFATNDGLFLFFFPTYGKIWFLGYRSSEIMISESGHSLFPNFILFIIIIIILIFSIMGRVILSINVPSCLF
jgi:hypothetical protein